MIFAPRKKIITSPFRQRGNIVGFIDPSPPPGPPTPSPQPALNYILKESQNTPEGITGNVRYDVFFKPDGTRVWTHRDTGVTRQYDVSPPWSIVPGDWTFLVQQDIVAGSGLARTIEWNDDGTILTSLQRWFSSFRRLVSWDQSATPYDITVLGAAVVKTGIPGNEFNIEWKPGGLVIYISKLGGIIDAFPLTVPYDITTMSLTPIQTFDSTVDAGARSVNMGISADGTFWYSVTSTNLLCSWEMTTPFDVSTSTNFVTGVSVILPTPLQIPRGLLIRPDNLDIYLFRDQSSQNMRIFQLPSPVVPDPDITDYTLTVANPLELTLIANNHHSAIFNLEGTRAYFGRGSAWQSLQYEMTVPGDLSTLTFETNLDFGFVSQFQRGITLNPDRSKFYHVRKVSASNDFLVSADPFSVSAAGDPGQNPYLLTNVQTLFITIPATPTFSLVSSNDQDWYILERSPTTQIHHYRMGTPGDATTAVYQGVAINLTSKFNVTVWNMAYSPDGSKLFVLGDHNGALKIVQYNLAFAYDITAATDVLKEIAVFPAFTINLSMNVWENPLGGFKLYLTYMDDINQPGLRYDQYDAP